MLTCFRCLSAATARSLGECGRPTNSRLLSRALPRSCSRMPFSPWCKERSGQGPPPPQRPAPGKQPHHLVRRGVCTCLAPSLSIRRANWQGHQSKWEKPFSPASVGWGRWRESRSLSGEQVRQQGSQAGAPTLGHPPPSVTSQEGADGWRSIQACAAHPAPSECLLQEWLRKEKTRAGTTPGGTCSPASYNSPLSDAHVDRTAEYFSVKGFLPPHITLKLIIHPK